MSFQYTTISDDEDLTYSPLASPSSAPQHQYDYGLKPSLAPAPRHRRSYSVQPTVTLNHTHDAELGQDDTDPNDKSRRGGGRSPLPWSPAANSYTPVWSNVDRPAPGRRLRRSWIWLGVVTVLVAVPTIALVLILRGALWSDLWEGGRVRDAVENWKSRWIGTPGEPEWDEHHRFDEGVDLLQVLNHDQPTPTLAENLREEVRYLTAPIHPGGYGSQFFALQKLLYFGQLTNRVVITANDLGLYYDAHRFFSETAIPSVSFLDVKMTDMEEKHVEDLPCWSVQESVLGFANTDQALARFDMKMHYWPLPRLPRGVGGSDIAFEALRMFDYDDWSRAEWIAKAQHGALPQQEDKQVHLDDVDALHANLKPDFTTHTSPTPDDHLLCLDQPLLLAPALFKNPFAPASNVDEEHISDEAHSWQAVGQHLRFNTHVSGVVDEVLSHLLDTPSSGQVPPYISVHLRSHQLRDEHGAADIRKYVTAVDRIRRHLQERFDHPDHHAGAGHVEHKLRGDQYAVIATVDDPSETDILHEIREHGWIVIDHQEIGTEDHGLSEFVFDAAVLSNAVAFVGTEASSFSRLASLRVKYWHAGPIEWAF